MSIEFKNYFSLYNISLPPIARYSSLYDITAKEEDYSTFIIYAT